jgi:PAS domain S-box-containing protein
MPVVSGNGGNRGQKLLDEKDYRLLLENLPEGVGVTDMEENLVYVNDAFSRMLGYSSEEMRGENVRNLVPAEAQKTLAEATAERLEGVSSAYNLPMIRKDGTQITVRVSGVPRRSVSGAVIGTMAVVTDVTSEKQAEQELRKLSRAVDQSPTSVVITDADGTIEYVNPKFTQLTGYKEQEVLGENPRVLKSGQTPPETYEELWRDIRAGREWRGTFINRKKNGELYIEDAWISPIHQPDGQITHFVAVKQDISRRVEAEQRLQYSLRDLELYSSLLQHDLRNDLQVLINHVEASMMLLDTESTVHEYLDAAEGYAERIVRLLDVFGRPGSEERNLAKILEQVKKQAEKAHSDLKAEIRMENDELRLVSARLLPMVFDNLLRNAAEYSKGKARALIEVRRQGDSIEVVFSDAGPGIPEEVKSRLFDKGASTTGGGYGLYLSRRVVEAYNGTMELIESRLGGASFRILLPSA